MTAPAFADLALCQRCRCERWRLRNCLLLIAAVAGACRAAIGAAMGAW